MFQCGASAISFRVLRGWYGVEGPHPLCSRGRNLGLEDVEAIAAVEGIDMIAYGHSDLSARLGVHLQQQNLSWRGVGNLPGGHRRFRHGQDLLLPGRANKAVRVGWIRRIVDARFAMR